MKRTAVTTLVLAIVLQAAAQIADPAQAAALVAQLEDAPTSAARFNLLNGRDFVFDFNAGVGVSKGAGGNVTVANLADFPFLVGQGMSLAVGKIEPCGLSAPHSHPRATEFLYMISGSNLKVGFIQENGARFVTNTLNAGEGAIFPKGSIHFQANLDCHPVTFVAGLNSADPGVSTAAQRFFGLPPDVVDATLGGIGVDKVVQIATSIPDTFALGVQSCLDKCKIHRGDQPKNQQQPRVGGNEFPSSSGSPDSHEDWTGDDEDEDEDSPSKPSHGGGYGDKPSPDGESENDWNSDEWYDNSKWDEEKHGDDKSKWGEKKGDGNYNKHEDASSPSRHNWWDKPKGDSGVKKYPEHHGGKHNDDTKWDEKKWDEEKYGWGHYHKRSGAGKARITPSSTISSLIPTDARALGELTFFLKLVLFVLLSGYAFVLAYFVVPIWRNRGRHVELQARAVIPPSIPLQDVKA